MNVYDFDKTIYRGDSTRDFYFYLLKKHIGIIKHLPKTAIVAIKYVFGATTKTAMKESFFQFLNDFSNGEIEKEVSNFWTLNKNKINDWYREKKKNDDVIISASPRFILAQICSKLNVHLICSEVNVNNGDYDGLNCWGEEKVNRFFKEYPDGKIDEFYSDSWSDEPLARYANKAYLVKSGGKIVPWAL